MEVVVNVVCPQCGSTLVYEDGVGHCLLCATYWTLVHNMIMKTTPPNTSEDDSRQLAENIEEIMQSHPGG